MSLGRITNALFSGTNENTLQLAGFNIDFSLLKVEAPEEFQGLGAALSRRRRIDAEDGPLHQTARKLGALFEQVLPNTPNLVKAYGTRASSIFDSPGVNPQGSRKDGPFEPFVGADGTSLWAAATSGPASIAVHLLACMLARSWNAKVATSIWVELLVERKKEIEVAVRAGSVISMGLAVAGEDVTREQIRLWDSSARSWLESADKIKLSEQKKLDLILKNITISVSGGATTYSNVMAAWKQAMVGLEKLILGIPQQICDGSVLLAISSWHIFPNLLVLGMKTVTVVFGDPLVNEGGVITIGLQSPGNAKGQGIGWSLALSHLRYYGGCVPVTHEDIKGRVTMEELRLVALGSLLRKWNLSVEDAVPVSRWITALWDLLNGVPSPNDSSTKRAPMIQEKFQWLDYLVRTARNVLALTTEDLDSSMLLIGYGFRRGQNFIGKHLSTTPFFGLFSQPVLSSLAQPSNVECGIQYFREVASRLGLKDGDAIITYTDGSVGQEFYEYATAIPHQIAISNQGKRLRSGDIEQPQTSHSRWFKRAELRDFGVQCNCMINCTEKCPCRQAGQDCRALCHDTDSYIQPFQCMNCGLGLGQRATELAARDELYNIIGYDIGIPSREGVRNSDGRPPNMEGDAVLVWNDPPLLFTSHREAEDLSCSPESKHTPPRPCSCYDSCALYEEHQLYHWQPAKSSKQKRARNSISFDLIAGSFSFQHHGLWLRRRGRLHQDRRVKHSKYPSLGTDEETKDKILFCESIIPKYSAPKYQLSHWSDPESSIKDLARLNSTFVLSYMDAAMGNPPMLRNSAIELLMHPDTLPLDQWLALRGLEIASSIYGLIPGTTVPLSITSTDISDARWQLSQPSGFSLAQTFACILMFETGTANIDVQALSNVMAMSSGSSIFVATRLVSDPALSVPQHHIKRIVGNVGLPGISLLVAPRSPRVRGPSDDWRLVRHAKYDFKREDNFKGTTLHLSFTDWKMPLDSEPSGTVDNDMYLVESVISVHDTGEWVADIDPLLCNKNGSDVLNCTCLEESEKHPEENPAPLISIDNWEEFIDSPHTTGVFRAHGNWAARLAAASILTKDRQYSSGKEKFFVCTSKPCLRCFSTKGSEPPKVFID